MSESNRDPFREIVSLFMGFLPARAIYVAAKLGIADLIGEEAKDAAALAGLAGADPRALHRILRVLAGIGLLHQDGRERFSLTETGSLLRSDSDRSVRDYVILYHELQYPSQIGAVEAVRTGAPAFDKAFGAPFFDHVATHPEASALLQRGLAARARLDAIAILDAFDFSGANWIVDVGGGAGGLLAGILDRYEGTRGTVFDVPTVIDAIVDRPPRCEFAAATSSRRSRPVPTSTC